MARLPKGQDFSVYSSPSFQFWYEDKYYTVQGAETIMSIGTKDDIATMRAEYTRMRDVAQKRIKRLAEKFPESKAAQHYYETTVKKKVGTDSQGKPIYKYEKVTKRGFQELKNIDPRDLPKAFAELAKFVRAKGSTVTGQQSIKEKTMKTWQDQGLDLNPQNYDKTIRILEEMRRQKLVYGSDKAVELAETMLEMDDQQTNEWLDHLDFLLQHTGELKDIPEARGRSFDEVQELLTGK